jgi:4-hydroxy-3-methylbut-2-enyl diphosphate reductase
VERAVEIVERALALYGAPVYVRRQIVHNAHVVEELERRGAIFVESEEDVPVGALLVLSAHGVAPAVHERAKLRRLRTIDATCPLVAKVHAQARRYAAQGFTILLVGHNGHEEVEGTLGEAPEATIVVETVGDAEAVRVEDPTRVAYVTQTTLSVDETAEIVATLRRRFPLIEGPQEGDICYATTNRQRAVKELAAEVDLLLVIGSQNSSNSNRLVETARAAGVDAHLIEDETAIDERWLERAKTVGLTSGASAPERLVPCARGRRPPGRDGRRGRPLPPAARAAPRAASGLDLAEVERPADLDLDGQRLLGDPLAVALEQVGVRGRDLQPDPVADLEAALLAQHVDGVRQVEHPRSLCELRRDARIESDDCMAILGK